MFLSPVNAVNTVG